MNKLVLFIFLLISSNAMAGLEPQMLADTLGNEDVKIALSGQVIDSVKVVQDELGRTMFDFTLVICGQSLDESVEPPVSLFNTTRIAGRAVFFGRGYAKAITQSSGETADPVCREK
ncbi:MAG: hypothetical protein NDJ90_10925 [Oligoflexia bacterium]|nr:hypothetical protein [Oligoflexia bacterium]